MVEYLRKSESRGDRIALVNYILIIQIYKFSLLLCCVGVLCDADIFK